MSRRISRSGITITELLVTISALSVLLTLAVLATGCADNGNTRRQCGNNIKQLALGLQNYHDTFQYLPYGSRNRSTEADGSKASWGSSWLVANLRYCEQAALFDRLTETDKADPKNDYLSGPMLAAASNPQPISYMVCPSSPLPKTQSLQGATITVPSYAGIMGAKVKSPNGETDSRTVDGPFGGYAAGSGMLVINEALTVAACTDGTANVIIVGEVSNWYYDDQGNKRNPALSISDAGSGPKPAAGWLAGNNLDFLESNRKQGVVVNQGGPAIGPDRCLNLIAIEHPVNANNRGGKDDPAPNWGTGGVGRCGFNNPLSSAHGDGAFVGYLDGHVVQVSSKVSPDILQRLAVRDDGAVIPDLN